MITLRLAQNTIADDLDKLIRRIANPGPRQTRSIGDAIRRGFQDNFTTEGSASGQPWRPLAQQTIQQRIELGFAGEHPILVRTGRYRASFVQLGAPGQYESIRRTGGSLIVEEGSDDERADDLGLGTFRIPPRPVTELGPRSEKRIMDTIDFMIDQLEREVIG